MANPIFTKSNDTSILEDAIRRTPEGEVIAYDELSTRIGRDVREFAGGQLASARNILERDGLHTAAVINEGIKRLTPAECLDKAASHVVRSRRAAKRSRTTIETTEFERLTEDERSRAFALSAQSAAIELFGSRKAGRKLLEKTQETSAAIPFGETLKLFGGVEKE